jgi:hypothetical protein
MNNACSSARSSASPADQALERCLDVLLRMCTEVARACHVEQTTDVEMDVAIIAAATALHGADTRQWPAPLLTAWLRSAAPSCPLAAPCEAVAPYQTRH